MTDEHFQPGRRKARSLQTLRREVRFSVNPFLPETPRGSNTWSASPAGTGLCLYLAIDVCLAGTVDPQTGFIINIIEVDRMVRETAVPRVEEALRTHWNRREHVSYRPLTGILTETASRLVKTFASHSIIELALHLNPARTMTLKMENPEMILFSEKFEFAAMHTLWNPDFTEDRNYEIFGKCAHKTGHGHNYLAEIQVIIAQENIDAFNTGAFEEIVDAEFIDLVDHKNLNTDLPYFQQNIPTVENLSRFAFETLEGRFPPAELYAVTIWETSRTASTFYNPRFSPVNRL